MISLRIAAAALVLAVAPIADAAGGGVPDAAVIEKLTGLKGKANDTAGVFKVQMPRSDLSVKVAGAKVTPPMGLTCWAAFKKAGNETIVMGDIVLREDQVNAVMDAAINNGLAVTGLHNHFMFENPRIMFMHIGGMGTDKGLAASVGKVFAAVKSTAGGRGGIPKSRVDPAKSKLTTSRLETLLGPGEYKDGVFKVTIGRTTKMDGHEVGREMGVNTWAAFAGTDRQAVVDGDFAMLERELQEVLMELRKAGISVVAIHNHMTNEEPRIMFLHFWGVGKAETLAQGIKAALGRTAAGE